MGHGKGAPRERVYLEDTHRSVPEDRLRILHRFAEQLDRGGADVQRIPALRDFLNGNELGLGSQLSTVRHDAVHGQVKLDPTREGVFLDAPGKLQHVILDQRVTDFLPHCLDEGEGHASADDDLIHALPQVLDDLDFSGDLGSSKNGHEWANRIGDSAFEVFDLLL